MSRHYYSQAFTLIELLVVIAIIGILASVTLASLNDTRDQARSVSAVQEMRSMYTNVLIYLNDTGQLPPECSAACDNATDPFLNPLGVSGWNGPYNEIWSLSHPWGGSYSLAPYDRYQDGSVEYTILLDDDAPNTSDSNNQGRVPTEMLVKMDQMLDDGDLSTGDFVGDGRDTTGPGGTSVCPPGEGCWAIDI